MLLYNIKEIQEFYDAGNSVRKTAEHFNINRSVLERLANQNVLITRPSTNSRKIRLDWFYIKEYYDLGHSIEECVKKFDIKSGNNFVKKMLCSDCENKTIKYIEKSRVIHGDKYDYSKFIFTKTADKSIIICRVAGHGEFLQIVSNHIKGAGCPKCNYGRPSKANDQFIEEAKLVHDNFYDYSKFTYNGSTTKSIIICPIHGDFEQRPANHLQGQGCPICRYIKASETKRRLLLNL